jgi:formiminotetrahydrofolate cyclodeaminase
MTDQPEQDSIWGWTLADFRDRTAGDAPTPGGGSVAMVTASNGVGLVLMALRITARRPDADAVALAPLIEAGDRRLQEFVEFADADIAVFQQFMAAMKLPRETEEDKAVRRRAIREATVAATEVPLNAAQSTLEALDLTRQAAAVAHPNILSDVAAGGALLYAALTAVLYNVDVNLKGLRDNDNASDYARSRAHLQEAAERRRTAIAAAVLERMAG